MSAIVDDQQWSWLVRSLIIRAVLVTKVVDTLGKLRVRPGAGNKPALGLEAVDVLENSLQPRQVLAHPEVVFLPLQEERNALGVSGTVGNREGTMKGVICNGMEVFVGLEWAGRDNTTGMSSGAVEGGGIRVGSVVQAFSLLSRSEISKPEGLSGLHHGVGLTMSLPRGGSGASTSIIPAIAGQVSRASKQHDTGRR